MDSILISIKKLLGLDANYTHFDQDLTIYINSVLAILSQLGVGPAGGLVIEDADATWVDFLGSAVNFETVKSYVYLKVKLLFDPPTSSALIESINKMIGEYEFRIFVQADPALVVPPVDTLSS